MGKKSDEAAAKLYRLAQATAPLRLYREMEGREAESMETLAVRARQHYPKKVKPTEADYQAVIQEDPDLAVVAGRSNPFLSGKN